VLLIYKETFISVWRGLLMTIVLTVLLAACDTELTPTPTLFVLPTVSNPVAASATVAAHFAAPTVPPGGNFDSQNFVPAAPNLVSSDIAVTITPTLAPTLAALALYIPAGDMTLFATYYPASHAPAPTILLVSGAGESRAQWKDLPAQLQAAGFIVVSIDLRGSGETGGTPDWVKAPADVASALAYVRTLPGSDPTRSGVVGSGIGANLAMVTCAAEPACTSAALLSPRALDQGISAKDAIGTFGKRALLILTSADDDPSAIDSTALDNAAQGAHHLQRFDGKAHGLALLAAHPEISGQIVDWLSAKRTTP